VSADETTVHSSLGVVDATLAKPDLRLEAGALLWLRVEERLSDLDVASACRCVSMR